MYSHFSLIMVVLIYVMKTAVAVPHTNTTENNLTELMEVFRNSIPFFSQILFNVSSFGLSDEYNLKTPHFPFPIRRKRSPIFLTRPLTEGLGVSKILSTPLKRHIMLCDFIKKPGGTCASCHEAIICLPGNVGIIKHCSSVLPYCFKGRCSLTPNDECKNTTSSTNTDSTLSPAKTTSASNTVENKTVSVSPNTTNSPTTTPMTS
ncbi:uncharacterized protein LOC110386183 [Bombyx mori]|uniref:Uncharacterized protein n=1 Tax=Bombyx mori TaxID=7091 RepID=A0A8R2DMY0_BOMMO|nr:uncharacterized protein LOC110386183 [Bombyx mori]